MNTKRNQPQFLTGALLLVCMSVFGQDNSGVMQPQETTQPNVQVQSNGYYFDKGSNIINLGVGLGGYYSYWGGGYYQTPDFVIAYENGTFGDVGPGVISLGGLFAYKGISYNWATQDGYSYTERWNYWILGFRSAYHLQVSSAPKFDPYAGLMLGYYFLGYSFSTDNPGYMHPGNSGYVYYTATYPDYYALSVFLGARYALSNKVGIWGELGYGYSTLALGVSFKM